MRQFKIIEPKLSKWIQILFTIKPIQYIVMRYGNYKAKKSFDRLGNQFYKLGSSFKILSMLTYRLHTMLKDSVLIKEENDKNS